MVPDDSGRPSACPFCGAGKAEVYWHSPYERNYIDWIDGQTVLQRIAVRRFRCHRCGRTGAILPADIPLHGQYCLHFISEVLREYEAHETTVAELCDTFLITPSMLYRWISRYSVTDLMS